MPGPVFIGMTATGALIARHVADLFPTQTSRFDLAQAARRGVTAPLRCLRIPPGPGVRSLAKVPLRRGEVDQTDQEELAAAGPRPVQRRDRRPVPVAVPPGARCPPARRREIREQRRFRLRDVGISTRRRCPARHRRAGRDPRRVRARRGGRALQRHAARRGMELAASDDLHAPGPHRLPRRVYQQRRARYPPRAPGRRWAWSSTSCTRRRPRTSPIVTLQLTLDRDAPSRRRDRGRSCAPRARAPGASRAPGRACRSGSRATPRRPRARALADRRRELNHSEQHAWAALAGAPHRTPGGARRR